MGLYLNSLILAFNKKNNFMILEIQEIQEIRKVKRFSKCVFEQAIVLSTNLVLITAKKWLQIIAIEGVC